VSAATVPKPDEAPDPASDADGWALLAGLRRKLDDQAASGRKTQAQVAQLADSIAALVEQQRRRSLWLNLNSFVAYVVFTILCGTGCFLLYRSRAHELGAARDQAVGERDAAVRRADDATARGVAREAADHKAWEVYQLLESGRRGEAVAKLDALRDQPLSRTERAVLAARVHDTQVMEVDAALKAAAASLKAGRVAEVTKSLEAALAGEPASERAAVIHYYLGVAYAKTDLDKALRHLQAAVAGDVDQDDARFQLASVLDRSAAYAQARAEYDRFATAHPQSPLAMFAMRRSATLARLSAPSAAAGSPGAGAIPGAAIPAPAPAASPPAGQPPAPGIAPPGSRFDPSAPRPPGTLGAPGATRPPGVRPWPRPAAKPATPPGARSPASDPSEGGAEPPAIDR